MPLIELSDLCVYRAPDNIAPPQIPPGVAFLDATPENVARLFAKDARRLDTFLEFLESGYIGWFQTITDEWVTHAWVSPPGCQPPHLPAWVKALDVYWGFYGHTNEAFRGSGYFTRALHYGFWAVQQMDLPKPLLVDTPTNNLPSRYAMLTTGCTPNGRMEMIQIKAKNKTIQKFAIWRRTASHPAMPSAPPLEKSDSVNKKNKTRLVFFGINSQYSKIFLDSISLNHNVVAIVEGAPRAALQKHGVFSKLHPQKPSHLAKYAEEKHIPYLFLRRGMKNELVAFLESVNPDLGCVASFSQLIPQAAIDIPKHGIINVHPALLPKFRGPNPWLWVYLEMETESGVTIHFIDKGEDTGDILLQESFHIPLGMPLADMQKTAINIGTRLMNMAIDQIASGTTHILPQRDIQTSPRARNVEPGEKFIDWRNWPVERIFHALVGGQRWLTADFPKTLLPYFIWEAVDFTHMEETTENPGQMGLGWKGFYIKCRNGIIYIRLRFNAAAVKKALGS